jgi:hypothetical protein
MAANDGRRRCWNRRQSRSTSISRSTLLLGQPARFSVAAAGLISKGASATGIATVVLAGTVALAGCGPSFQQRAASECAGISTDTAYEDCRRSLAEQLADQRLGYIARSQVVR